MNQLHANVLDVFNEQGVQIMSPHYMADPPQPQIVRRVPGRPSRQPKTLDRKRRMSGRGMIRKTF
jgi:hypothetical protein